VRKLRPEIDAAVCVGRVVLDRVAEELGVSYPEPEMEVAPPSGTIR
jgi:hypothetical protein